MSIRVQLADGTPLGKDLPQGEGNRPKIRVTLDGQPVTPPLALPAPQGRLPAPEAVEPVPPKVLAFWNYDEDAHRADRPWRYQESPNEQTIREQAERDGCWAGL
jgi:hypothetical protein